MPLDVPEVPILHSLRFVGVVSGYLSPSEDDGTSSLREENVPNLHLMHELPRASEFIDGFSPAALDQRTADGFPGGYSLRSPRSELPIAAMPRSWKSRTTSARPTRGDDPDVRSAEAAAVPCLVVSLVCATCIDWRHGAGLPSCFKVPRSSLFPHQDARVAAVSYRQQRLVEVGEVHVVDILGLGGLVTEGFDDVPFVAYRHDRLEYVRE